MRINRLYGLALGICTVRGLAFGQGPPPIADPVQEALVPAHISELPIILSGELAYLFSEPDGTDVVHIVGDFGCQLGEDEGQKLKGREGIIWISPQQFDKISYRHLEIYLWRDAEIKELANTVTTGPALFVTLDSKGPLSTSVDEFAYQSSAGTPSFIEATTVRKEVASKASVDTEAAKAWRVFDPTGLGVDDRKPRPKPTIHFQTRGEFKGPISHEGHRVLTVIGRVYLSRGTSGSSDFLEIQSDSVVVFLSGDADLGNAFGGDPPSEPQPTENAGEGKEATSDVARRPRRSDPATRQVLSAGFGQVEVEGVYLEGDVLMTSGPHMVRASRLYYDFSQERALMLDAVVRTLVVQRNIPLYIRAAEIRQLSTNQIAAEDALLTTSEFHTPHYHIGAQRVELVNRTPPELGLGIGQIRAGSYTIRHGTLNIGNVPVAYWPFLRGTVDTSESAIQSVRLGYSDDFGAEVETRWDLFSLMGLEHQKGVDTSLKLDHFSERGPAVGVDAKYERDRYFGLLRSYLIDDGGEDSLGRERDQPSQHDLRGRFLLRHRQYLEDDWQLSLEMSFLSDRSFLEEFFESEFDNEKEQETLLYLKKQRENWAFTALLQTRVLDFTTQTERYPDFGYFRLGEPLGDRASWFSENRLGVVRFRDADRTFLEWLRFGSTENSGTTIRADSRQEVGAPVDVGAIRLVPYVAGRGTVWDDSIDDGGLARTMGLYGVRGSMYLSRVYSEARSELFDVHGLRHIVKPTVTAWGSHSNVDSRDVFPFDETVERIDELDGVTLGMRQRWQTKRGPENARRNVDVLTFSSQLGVFNDAPGDDFTNGFTSFSRPENSISRNFINQAMIWRVNDRTAVLYESNYDLNDRDWDILNVSLAVERTPRFNYVLGYRFIDGSNSNVLALDTNYRLTEKHTIALREAFDLDQGQTLDFTVALIRRLPRWYTAVSFELDEAEDDVGLSFTLWPEGLPQAAIGSRRFTGLANTTSIERR